MNNIYINFTFVPKCSAVHSLSQRKILLDDQLCSTEKKKFCQEKFCSTEMSGTKC